MHVDIEITPVYAVVVSLFLSFLQLAPDIVSRVE